MGDVVFLAILIGFFTLAVLFVRACDRIVGPDTQAIDTADTKADASEAAA
jgi:hypothetical protein